jgi:hypothetical protein
MAGYEIRDREFIRGTTPTMLYRFKKKDGLGVKVPIPFDVAILSVFKGNPGKTLLFREVMPITDPQEGEVTLVLTADHTRSLAPSLPGDLGKNSYEIELRDGTNEKVYVIGAIAGIGGLNSDQGGA